MWGGGYCGGGGGHASDDNKGRRENGTGVFEVLHLGFLYSNRSTLLSSECASPSWGSLLPTFFQPQMDFHCLHTLFIPFPFLHQPLSELGLAQLLSVPPMHPCLTPFSATLD